MFLLSLDDSIDRSCLFPDSAVTGLRPSLIDECVHPWVGYVDCVKWLVVIRRAFYLLIVLMIFLVVVFEHIVILIGWLVVIFHSQARRVPWPDGAHLCSRPWLLNSVCDVALSSLEFVEVWLGLVDGLCHFVLEFIGVPDSMGQVVGTRLI